MFKMTSPLIKRLLSALSKRLRYKLFNNQKQSTPTLLTSYILENQLFNTDPLTLVDVGASGGISSFWNVFQDQFSAIGFEPLVAECVRLNQEKQKTSSVSYHPYFIVSDDPEVESMSGPRDTSSFYERASSIKYTQLTNLDYIQEQFNQGNKAVYTDKKISLDHYFVQHPVKTIDFIKIDTDGHDYAVLHGAKNILKNKEVLGIQIECQLHGENHHHSNVFRNIDRTLTENGFRLYDISLYKYSRSKLPHLFSLNIPAQTVKGQMLWGDALYLRDYAQSTAPVSNISAIKVLKLASLYECFDLADCAAELILAHQDLLKPYVDVTLCLDLLVKGMGVDYSYEDYLNRFEQNPEDFFPPSYTILDKQ